MADDEEGMSTIIKVISWIFVGLACLIGVLLMIWFIAVLLRGIF